MSPSSMTGFAVNSVTFGSLQIDFSLKSVNSKGLEIRVKVPSDYDGLDLDIKKRLSKQLVRGSVNGVLSIKSASDNDDISVNTDYLKALIETIKPLKADDVAVEQLMGLPGVLGQRATPKLSDDLKATVLSLVDQTASALKDVRKAEGAEIGRVLANCVAEMREVTAAAKECASQRPEAVATRYNQLLSRLDKGVEGVDPDRLAQEVALLAIKIDVAEELDRLEAHFKAVEAGLKDGGPIGRTFDFLAQELVREANTLCSKSQDKDLTAQGLKLKSLIDRFREQALNIE